MTGLERPLRLTPSLQASLIPSLVTWRTGNYTRKQPLGVGLADAVPIAQDRQKLIGEHDVAILLTLALSDTRMVMR